MVRSFALAVAAIFMGFASPAAFADSTMTHSELQKLFPGTFLAVVNGGVTLTFTAKGDGVLVGQMPGKHDQGRWSVQNGRLCIMLNTWTSGRSSCSQVVADNGWYRGSGVKFRKI